MPRVPIIPFLLLALSGLAPRADAQTVYPSVTVSPDASAVQPPAPQAPANAQPAPLFTPDQLDQLVGAIALYPDPLIAQVLPAATYPLDIVQAARFVNSGAASGNDAAIDQQEWDPSVKAVARYPSVLNLLDQNLQWTQQLGHAFLTQPGDVMAAVQRQRARAQQLGNLTTTPQQEVVVADDTAIRILPANPEVLYVPVYQPSVVYYQPAPLYSSWVSFGYGYPLGAWCNLEFSWYDHQCYYPGWTWNHWHDHYYVQAGHLHAHHDSGPHGHDGGHHSDSAWRHDDRRPGMYSNHPLSPGRTGDRTRNGLSPSGGARSDTGSPRGYGQFNRPTSDPRPGRGTPTASPQSRPGPSSPSQPDHSRRNLQRSSIDSTTQPLAPARRSFTQSEPSTRSSLSSTSPGTQREWRSSAAQSPSLHPSTVAAPSRFAAAPRSSPSTFHAPTASAPDHTFRGMNRMASPPAMHAAPAPTIHAAPAARSAPVQSGGGGRSRH